jgi:hypothetical protein
VSTQTDPVQITACGSGSSAPVDASTADVWGQSDEEAQMDAIRTIQLLSQKRSDTGSNDRRIAELEEMLNRERAGRRDMEAKLEKEKSVREALQQQVLCLETEMDTKESALQASHRIVERFDDLQQTESALGVRPMLTQPALTQASIGSSFRGASPVNRRDLGRSLSPTAARVSSLSVNTVSTLPLGDEAGLLAARRHLMERDNKLEAKDQQISQLLRELRQTPDTHSGINDFDGGLGRPLSPMARLNLTSGYRR